MQLKTSFFNPTLFKKNLTRSWPLWGGVSAVGSLVPLYLLLAVMNQIHLETNDFSEIMFSAAAYFLPAFTICYAVLVSMFVWSYLHNSRAVGMMHSLAIDRTTLFVTNTLSGLAMLLIPYVIVGGLLCLVAAGCGALDVLVMLQTIAVVILENLLFFGIGTLCAMVTGNVLAVAVFYVIVNFAAPLLDVLIQSLAETFIFGITISSVDGSKWFSPIVALYDTVDVIHVETGETTWVVQLEGFWLIVVYGLVGAALLALSWWLYRFRRSESAGDVVAFTWLRPVFRYGIACVSSLTLGRVLYELFWNTLFYDGYGAIVPMCICMVISAVVGYYVASMLLDKSLRVFRGSLKKVAVVSAAVVVLCLVVALDLFGVERYVPDAGDVASVEVWGCVDLTCDSETLPGVVEDICALHEAIVADKDYIKHFDDYDGEWNWRSLTIRYKLKNGSEVYRGYQMPVRAERAKDPDTYEGKLYALITDPEVLKASVTIPSYGQLEVSYLEFYNPEILSWESVRLDSKQWEVVQAALLQDAAEGNFVLDNSYMAELKSGDTFYYDAILYMEYVVRDKDVRDVNGYYNMLSVRLQPPMKHTLAALKSVGALTQDTINSWYWNEKEGSL